MEIIQNKIIKEKVYKETLENGMKIMIIPKKNTKKKYVIWGTHFGSVDNEFILNETGEQIRIPDGVAHFLEHKMFEQENGRNSLDTLMALGIDANAYTTNDHTAYLFECNNYFYEGLDELMDYVQNPYFTDENVEKEKGIIAQEIKMYDDEPGWQLYKNLLDCMYVENPVKIDIAGTVDSISEITKETLYNCYNTFYHPSNMTMVICGDFVPEEILEEVKMRLVKKDKQDEIKRITSSQTKGINKKKKEVMMEVSQPLFAIGFKDEELNSSDIVRKDIAIEILLNLIIGKSSNLYKKLYESGNLLSEADFDFEYTSTYSFVMIMGQSKNPEKIYKELQKEIEYILKEGIKAEDFDRLKKKIYGDYVSDYNSVAEISRMFLSDSFKNIETFDYINEYQNVTKEYTLEVMKNVFKEENMALSVINCK